MSEKVKPKSTRYDYLVLCDGGPPDADGCTTVGAKTDTLGKACGRLESMMKALGASFGQIVRSDSDQYEEWDDSREPVHVEAPE